MAQPVDLISWFNQVLAMVDRRANNSFQGFQGKVIDKGMTLILNRVRILRVADSQLTRKKVNPEQTRKVVV